MRRPLPPRPRAPSHSPGEPYPWRAGYPRVKLSHRAEYPRSGGLVTQPPRVQSVRWGSGSAVYAAAVPGSTAVYGQPRDRAGSAVLAVRLALFTLHRSSSQPPAHPRVPCAGAVARVRAAPSSSVVTHPWSPAMDHPSPHHRRRRPRHHGHRHRRGPGPRRPRGHRHRHQRRRRPPGRRRAGGLHRPRRGARADHRGGARDALARFRTFSDLQAAADADLVIEVVPESYEIKQQVFRALDADRPPGHDPRHRHQRPVGDPARRRLRSAPSACSACTSSTRPRR